MGNQRGFTIVELLIVIIIIAIIAVIALPQFINAQDRGKQTQTVANLRSLSNALALYYSDNNKYPTASDILTLKDFLEENGYMAKAPIEDGWGQLFQVNSIDNSYTLWSCGKGNGEEGSCTLSNAPVGIIHDFSEQIILSNGSFTQYPAGVQQ